MKFLDQCQGFRPLRRRRRRLRLVPARKIHRIRRTERRRRRARRRRRGRMRRWPEHPDRLPLPAALQGRTGGHGMGTNRHGAKGADVVCECRSARRCSTRTTKPCSPISPRSASACVLAHGGNGGFGNAHFKCSTNRAPRHANPGQPGEERWIWLRLKLIADAGLVGLPNAGKSTFLAASAPPSRRSPTIRSPRCTRSSAWCRSTRASSSLPTFRA